MLLPVPRKQIHKPLPGPSPQAGFTLLELLLVVVILGIVTAVIVPRFGASLAGGRLATAARSAMQASRYARTMALLHQAETVLLIQHEGPDAWLKVQAAPPTGERATHEEVGLDPMQPISPAEGSFEPATIGEAVSNQPVAHMTAEQFADAIDARFRCEQVRFRFMGYRDNGDDDQPTSTPDGDTDPDRPPDVRLLFGANGICRPFRLRVLNDETEWLDIEFDMTGAGKAIQDE